MQLFSDLLDLFGPVYVWCIIVLVVVFCIVLDMRDFKRNYRDL